jgi:hypothetical protein
MFLPDSRPKRRLLRQIQRLLRGLRADQRVLEAVAFDGPLTPARRGELLEQRPEVPVARFDLAVLVETTSPATAAELEAEPLWGELAGSRLHGVEVRAMNTSAATQVRSGTPPRGRAGGVALKVGQENDWLDCPAGTAVVRGRSPRLSPALPDEGSRLRSPEAP